MSVVIACYKWVIDEADLRINADLSVDSSKAKGKISDYDKNAIEASVQIAAELGGKPIGLTFGDSMSKNSLKDALSRGLEEAVWIQSEEAASADGRVTAQVMAAAIKKLENVSLIICAEGASDTYARQTAPRLGALLNLPVVTSVCNMQLQGQTLKLQRKLDDCLETVEVALPAIISVLPEVNEPTIPGLKAVMAAGKKPVTQWTGKDLGVDLQPRVQAAPLQGYVMNRKNIVLQGEPAEQVQQMVAALRKEGVL